MCVWEFVPFGRVVLGAVAALMLIRLLTAMVARELGE
jgi:hypothetical protein